MSVTTRYSNHYQGNLPERGIVERPSFQAQFHNIPISSARRCH